jgi:hypothetical protein
VTKRKKTKTIKLGWEKADKSTSNEMGLVNMSPGTAFKRLCKFCIINMNENIIIETPQNPPVSFKINFRAVNGKDTAIVVIFIY